MIFWEELVQSFRLVKLIYRAKEIQAQIEIVMRCQLARHQYSFRLAEREKLNWTFEGLGIRNLGKVVPMLSHACYYTFSYPCHQYTPKISQIS